VTTAAATTLDGYWDELVTVALLGTDRRDPPPPPPGLVADLVDDALRPSPSQRMLAAVAAAVAVRRAAFVAGPPAEPLAPPAADPRPLCPAAAADTWRYVVGEWPVLEDEWMLTLIGRGLRPAPDVVVAMLARHRSDAVRSARVALAAGPLARWLTEHVPELAPRARGSVDAHTVTSLPELAVPPELAPLLGSDSHSFSRALAAGFDRGRYGAAHRAVLVNLLARCRPEVLADVAAVLVAVDPMSPAAGLAHSLADLARTRERMLAELSAG
jgi:hypothetical protein